MLYTILFTFYVNGSSYIVKAGEAEDRDACREKAQEIYKEAPFKPAHMACVRKA